MSYISFLSKEFKTHLSTKLDDIKQRRDPDFFEPYGTQVHCGRQGSGKTISAVHTVLKLKERYPKAILVSNLSLSGYRTLSFGQYKALTRQVAEPNTKTPGAVFNPVKDYVHFSDINDLERVLTGVNNGFHGVIYLVDEIHTYFNALDSKNIPMHIFTEISQQRKQRKLIIGTSQLYMRMAKPLREQCDNAIFCKTIGGWLTIMHIYDGMELEQDARGRLIGDIKKRAWFFHSKKTREAFDTFQKVVSSDVQFEQFYTIYADKKNAKGFSKMLGG